MKNSFKKVLLSFLANRLTRQVKELYSATLIYNFAMAMVSIFEPVFLYLLFIESYSLKSTLEFVMLFYLVVYVIYLFVLPFGAKFAMKFGYEFSITIGTIFTALFYLSLFVMKQNIYFVFLAILFYILSKMFYWPAFHSNFASFSIDGQQGRELSNLLVLQSILLVLSPLIGGFVLEIFGFSFLFILASILMVLSNIPMLVTKENIVVGNFYYRDSFSRLFKKENRRLFFALLGYGEEMIVWVIWPIFIYIIVEGFLGLGFLTALTTFLTTLVFFYIGRATDKTDSESVLRLGGVFYFIGCFFRILARSVFGVFLIDLVSRVSKQAISIPIMAITYEKAQDGSVLNNVVFFEMSLVIGKIIAIVFSLVLLQFFSPGWNAMFILAGLMTLLYLFFKK